MNNLINLEMNKLITDEFILITVMKSAGIDNKVTLYIERRAVALVFFFNLIFFLNLISHFSYYQFRFAVGFFWHFDRVCGFAWSVGRWLTIGHFLSRLFDQIIDCKRVTQRCLQVGENIIMHTEASKVKLSDNNLKKK